MPEQMPMMRAMPRAKLKGARKARRKGIVPMPMAPAKHEPPKYLMEMHRKGRMPR